MWLVTVVFGLVLAVSPVPDSVPLEQCWSSANDVELYSRAQLMFMPGTYKDQPVYPHDLFVFCIQREYEPVIGLPLTGEPA